MCGTEIAYGGQVNVVQKLVDLLEAIQVPISPRTSYAMSSTVKVYQWWTVLLKRREVGMEVRSVYSGTGTECRLVLVGYAVWPKRTGLLSACTRLYCARAH
eukprot:1329310-Rhodomonas_salina.2